MRTPLCLFICQVLHTRPSSPSSTDQSLQRLRGLFSQAWGLHSPTHPKPQTPGTIPLPAPESQAAACLPQGEGHSACHPQGEGALRLLSHPGQALPSGECPSSTHARTHTQPFLEKSEGRLRRMAWLAGELVSEHGANRGTAAWPAARVGSFLKERMQQSAGVSVSHSTPEQG